jgi:hypothetical protein
LVLFVVDCGVRVFEKRQIAHVVPAYLMLLRTGGEPAAVDQAGRVSFLQWRL